MALTDGIVGCWSPSLGASGYRLLDRSGRGNHGTLTNMDAGTDWVGTSVGLSLDFDATDDVVSIPGSQVYIADGKPMTVAIWFYNRSFSSQYPKLMMLRSDDASGSAWEIGYSNQVNYLGVLIGTGDSYARLKSDTAAASLTGSWQHVVATYSGGSRSASGSFAVYLNGTALTMSGASAFSPTTNATSIALSVANNRHNGQIGECAIFNRPLAAAEIRDLYRRGNGAIGRELTGQTRRRTYGFVAATGARRRRILCGDYS
jgi:hypothetical protein